MLLNQLFQDVYCARLDTLSITVTLTLNRQLIKMVCVLVCHLTNTLVLLTTSGIHYQTQIENVFLTLQTVMKDLQQTLDQL